MNQNKVGMSRKLQELNLLDDFLFGKLVTYPGMGEQFCGQLISVILMMPYDPFGYDHMVYTIRNRCEELPDMPYDDGAKTIFLYTKDKKGNPSRQLRELLHYMEDSKEENACNDTLKDIHKMVTKVKITFKHHQ